MQFNDTFKTIVLADLKSGKVPMLIGEPGIGKSSFAEGLAAELRTKCFTLPCNQLADKADLTGARLVPTEDGKSYKQMFYPHAVISDAVAYAEANPGETPILFLDEINRTTPDVTSEALSIPTTRTLGSASLPSNIIIMCAGNDHGNVTSLDSASINRFVLYRIEPDVNTFIQVNPTLNEMIADVLRANPKLLFGKTVYDDVPDDEDTTIDDFDDEDDGMQQMTSPRSITALSDWLNCFDKDQLLDFVRTPSTLGENVTVLTEAVEGHVGHTEFAAAVINHIIETVTCEDADVDAKFTVTKPAFWDDLARMATTTRDQLATYVGGLRDKDKSIALLYALYEESDNSEIIDQLSRQLHNLERTDLENLITLLRSNKLHKPNVTYMCSLDANTHPLAGAYNTIINTMLSD